MKTSTIEHAKKKTKQKEQKEIEGTMFHNNVEISLPFWCSKQLEPKSITFIALCPLCRNKIFY